MVCWLFLLVGWLLVSLVDINCLLLDRLLATFVGLLLVRLNDWFTGWFICYLVYWLIRRSGGWFVGSLAVYWLDGYLAGMLACQLAAYLPICLHSCLFGW